MAIRKNIKLKILKKYLLILIIFSLRSKSIADETGAESDVPIGSFDQNGFSFASEMYYNANSVNYVAWFWKAGGTAVSN